jgi:hypothetical protein
MQGSSTAGGAHEARSTAGKSLHWRLVEHWYFAGCRASYVPATLVRPLIVSTAAVRRQFTMSTLHHFYGELRV